MTNLSGINLNNGSAVGSNREGMDSPSKGLALMPKYEGYKDSQVQWIGDIPANWDLEKAKWLFYKADRKPLVDDDIVTCFRDGQVTLRKNRRTEGFTNALKEHGYQRICKGDLVIHAMDAFAGAIGVSDSDGKSTPVYAACVPRKKGKVNSYYYAYYMRDLALSGFIVSLAKGIRERSTDFRFNDFAELLLPFPDYEEQTLIACFLDKKTTQIDDAIAIKEQQINLLKERKQIIIQQAVTQGLDPNVPMKDSGVDWIGEVPEHWECLNFRYLIDVLTDYTANGSFADLAKNVTYLDEPSYSRLVRLTDLRKNLLNDGVYLSEKSHKYLSKSELFGGELLMANVGAYAGLAWIMPKIQMPATLAPNMLMLKLKIEKVRVEYVSLLLNSSKYWGYISTIAQSAAQPKLNKENVRSLPIVLPPIDEQCEIHKSIMKSSHAIEEVIREQNTQIEKLKEYKTTLINSAVTGKIKITPEMVEQ